MSLADLLHKSPPIGHEATLARLTAELEEAKAKAEKANEAWAQATATEAENGGTDTSTSDRLDEELSRALREVKKLTAALKTTQERHEAAQAAAARDTAAARWAEAEALALERVAIAARVSESVRRLVEDFDALQEITTKIFRVIPKCPDQTGAVLEGSQLQARIALELRRLGFEGQQAAAMVWNAPHFAHAFDGVDSLIRRWAEEAMGAGTKKVNHA
jgi:vacuolar-type H+-ATPase subunit I/STV1